MKKQPILLSIALCFLAIRAFSQQNNDPVLRAYLLEDFAKMTTNAAMMQKQVAFGETHPGAHASALTDRSILDLDDDGMEDGWETLHGLDPTDPTDAWGDPDADRTINLFEFQLGTGPFNAATPTIVEVSAADALSDAFDTASPGTVIRIQGGEYPTRLRWYSGLSANHLRIMLQGSWNSIFTERDACSHPTVLDALDDDTALYISGSSGSACCIATGGRMLKQSGW